MVTRQTVLTAWAALLVALLLPAVLFGQNSGDREQQVRVHGTVVDHETGAPLDGVLVRIRSASIPDDLERFTNAEGDFGFEPVPVGVYHIRVMRLGYQTVDHTVQLTQRSRLDIEVELTSQAVALEPIIVATTRQSSLALTGFYDRMDRGLGRFVTRDDIETRNPFYITDLLRSMPGVHVAGPGHTGNRGIISMRGGCRPDVYVDGTRMIPPVPMDELFSVHDVEAIEVYSSAESPAQYSTSSGCGTVLVWTRRPERGGGQPFSWARLAVGVGFLAAGFLLTR